MSQIMRVLFLSCFKELLLSSFGCVAVTQQNSDLQQEDPRKQSHLRAILCFVRRCVVSCLFHFYLICLILIVVFLSPPPSIPPPPPLFLSKGTFFQKSTEPREKSDMGVPCKFLFYVLTPSSFFPTSLLIHHFLL